VRPSSESTRRRKRKQERELISSQSGFQVDQGDRMGFCCAGEDHGEYAGRERG
jgi:hypothetical protein